jgi:hypothetical protein
MNDAKLVTPHPPTAMRLRLPYAKAQRGWSLLPASRAEADAAVAGPLTG